MSMLEKLSDEIKINFSLHEKENKIEIWEEVDYCFSMILNKEELSQLINELSVLKDRLK